MNVVQRIVPCDRGLSSTDIKMEGKREMEPTPKLK
jgi:hypothetical protein